MHRSPLKVLMDGDRNGHGPHLLHVVRKEAYSHAYQHRVKDDLW